MPLEEDYVDALGALARVSAPYEVEAGGHLVLVGGGATAVLTDGAFPSFDFDVVAAADEVLHRTFLAEGFHLEDRVGRLLRGYHHPDHPRYRFEHVSGALFDGHAELSRLERLVINDEGHIILPSWEDMIAECLTQHEVASPTDDSGSGRPACCFGWRNAWIVFTRGEGFARKVVIPPYFHPVRPART